MVDSDEEENGGELDHLETEMEDNFRIDASSNPSSPGSSVAQLPTATLAEKRASSPPPPTSSPNSDHLEPQLARPLRRKRSRHEYEVKPDPEPRVDVGVPPQPQVTEPAYMGEFIAQGWATTSDMKGMSYIKAGSIVRIERHEADSRSGIWLASSKKEKDEKKGKGKQLTLTSMLKSSNKPVKGKEKENNIVRFYNEQGSGACYPISFLIDTLFISLSKPRGRPTTQSNGLMGIQVNGPEDSILNRHRHRMPQTSKNRQRYSPIPPRISAPLRL